jgi:hypothetical protein
MGLAGRGTACQEDEQQEKRIFFHVRALYGKDTKKAPAIAVGAFRM